MKPHIFRVGDRRGNWYLIHDGKRSVETGLGTSEAAARRWWEELYGTPPDGYAWVKETHSPQACGAVIASALERAGDTVRLVPLGDMVELARIGLAVPKAIAAFRDAKKKRPYSPCKDEQDRIDRAVEALRKACQPILKREQGAIPGMGGDGT